MRKTCSQCQAVKLVVMTPIGLRVTNHTRPGDGDAPEPCPGSGKYVLDTIADCLNHVFARYPALREEATSKGIEYAALVIHRRENVQSHHVVVPDATLRDEVRPAIRADHRGFVCEDGDDTVLVIASMV